VRRSPIALIVATIVVVVAAGTAIAASAVDVQANQPQVAGSNTTALFPTNKQNEPTLAVSPTDADVLASATGVEPGTVCPAHRWYELPMAPFMAADALGRPPLLLHDLVAEIAWPEEAVDVGLLETAGGVRSPITTDGKDTVDLAAALCADLVVLVAAAGLGAINGVRLCLTALTAVPVAVFLNRYDPVDDLHRRNLAWMQDHCPEAQFVTTIDQLAGVVIHDGRPCTG